MARGRSHYHRPDIVRLQTFEASPRNLGDCRGLSHKQIWAKFQQVYLNQGYTEHDLRRIHLHWLDASTAATK